MANRNAVFRLHANGLEEQFDEQGKSIQDVLCLRSDATGGMWMGVARAGLLRWQKGRLARIDATNGLQSVDSVHGIIEDHGAWWFATNRGVLRIEIANLHAAADGRAALVYQLLDKSDGLPSDQCPSGRQPICGRDVGGHLWFATQKGVAIIDAGEFGINTIPPTAVIEELNFYAPVKTRHGDHRRNSVEPTRLRPPFARRMLLPPGSRRIEIHYTGLSLTAPAKVGFQVKLDGLDDTWQSAGNRRIANYHELSPGDYVFRVRAANNDGLWNVDAAPIAFTVLPYYWQTGRFRYGSGLMIVAVSAGGAWWFAHSRQRRRREADEQFRLVVEAAPNAMIVINARGRMVLVNAECEAVFGYGREELIGRPIEMLFPERFRTALQLYRNHHFANPTARGTIKRRELVGRRMDHSEIPVEIGLTPFSGSHSTRWHPSLISRKGGSAFLGRCRSQSRGSRRDFGRDCGG